MSGYAITPPAPPPPTIEGDDHFVGAWMKLPRWQLPAGYAARAENQRFHNRQAETRKGIVTPVFANSFNAHTLLGSGTYSNPNGKEVTLLASNIRVFSIRSGAFSEQITTENPPVGRIEFCVQFDKVLMHSDDPDFVTQVWDGLSATGFEEIAAGAELINGVALIPYAPYSVNFQGRAWMPDPSAPGWFIASDINNYSVYDSILHRFRINSGTSDQLVGLYPYAGAAGMIVGKRRSFDLLGPIPGDLGDAWVIGGAGFSSAPPPRMTPIPGPKGVGMIARKAGVFAGDGEFHFLSDAGNDDQKGGIYRLVPSAGGLIIDKTPVSEKIAPLFARINWTYAGGAVAELDGVYVKWAVPLDGATFNNAILVYHLPSQEWAGVDLWFSRAVSGRNGREHPAIPNPLRIDNLLGFDYYGRRRVFALDHDTAFVRLLDEVRGEDQFATPSRTGIERQTYPIVGLLESRGYATPGANGTLQRQLDRAQVVLQTLDPDVTITELLQGPGAEEQRDHFLPDRTKYNTFSKPPFSLDNQNDDFLAPGRLDYAIECGDGFLPGTLPTPLEVEQETTRDLTLSRRCRYVSLRITNVGGSCATSAIVLQSEADQRTGRKG